MDSTQSVVATAGIGLIGVNFWTSKQRPAIVGTLWDKSDPAAGHRALTGIAGELLLVFILAVVAGQSDSLAYGMLAIVGALWILWAMQHYGAQAAPRPPTTNMHGN